MAESNHKEAQGECIATKSEAEQHLQLAMANAEVDFRDGQWEAIDHIVNQRGKVLCVQRTGWGKSMVYFVSARLIRSQGAGVTLRHQRLTHLSRRLRFRNQNCR